MGKIEAHTTQAPPSVYPTNLVSRLNFSTTIVDFLGATHLTYNARGNKLAQEAPGSLRRDYLSGIELADGAPESIYHPEGRALLESGQWKYEYVIRDHPRCLGKGPQTKATRVVFRPAPGEDTPTPLNTLAYYPFGMEIGGLSAGGAGYPYQYNGKELNAGVGWYDYGARWYDAALGRWNGVDPLAENYAPFSPFNYVVNNPINTIDPDGMRVQALNEETQNYILDYLDEQFGEGHGFSFNKRGELRHSKKDVAAGKEYSEDQQAIFDGILEITKDQNTDLYVNISEDENANVNLKTPEGFTFKQDQMDKDSDGNFQAGQMLEVGIPLGGKRNGVIMINRKLASTLQSSAEGGGKTEACESCVFIHEALDHGLHFVKTGAGTPPNPSMNPNIAKKQEVQYQNRALRVKGGAKAKIRNGKDHGIE